MTTAQRLKALGVVLTVTGDKLRYSAPKGVLTAEIIDDIKQNKTEIMSEISAGLDHWIAQVNCASTMDDVLTIVGQGFRPLEWTDQQRAQMAKTYIRRLEILLITP